MNAHTRRAIAYIASRLTGGATTSVYNYDAGGDFHFSGNVSGTTCNVYDHGQGCHIGGTPPSLYHYGKRRRRLPWRP
jgi:hypothetical protein